jgi:pimeloyl-ACP methyl ester carboxylesterase
MSPIPKPSPTCYKIALLCVLCVSVVFLLSACQTLFPSTSNVVPRFEKASCPFTPPQGVNVSCGYLVVPEDRAAHPSVNGATPAPMPNVNTIKLAVAIFKSTAAHPPADPIVYLEGGPGNSPLQSYVDNITQIFGPYINQRDFIMVDQRGTGYSTPSLACPEYTQEDINQLPLNLTPQQSDQRYNAALQTCKDRLVKQSVNLADYTTAASASDFNDLRQVLGYAQWNLYGTSYGTRLGLEILRDYPQGVRSAVIDSVLPPNVDWLDTEPANTQRALDLLFTTCAADSACSAAYPNLRTVFFDTAKKLDSSPVTLKITLPDVGLSGDTGKQADALINGDSFIGIIFQSMYVTSYLPDLPELIYQASQGNLEPVATLSSSFLASDKTISIGMYNSVKCAEYVPMSSPQKLAAAIQAYPDLGTSEGDAQGPFETCQIWGVPAAPAAEESPVTSSVPTLVLSGQFDPVTPPTWGQLAASTLSNGHFFEVPNAGHGSSVDQSCPQHMALTFFDNPSAAPDSSCLKGMTLTFSVPVQSMDVPLAPFTNSLLGISGQAPANWRTLSGLPGFYSPNGDLTDPEQLLVQAAPLSADQMFQQFNSQLLSQGIAFTATGQTRSTPNGLSFTLYTANLGVAQADMAIASSGGKSYLVLLQSPLAEHDALYNAVFLPVVDALKPG